MAYFFAEGDTSLAGKGMTDNPRPGPFRISITEDDQRDLQNRLQRARLPDEQEGVAWEQGTSKLYLQVTQTRTLEQVWGLGRSVVPC